MQEQRLPLVNNDDGIWGDVLNQYIGKEHYNGDLDLNPATSENGGHQHVTLQPGTATAGTAPLRFITGTPLSSPEPGAIEYNSDRFYITQVINSITNRRVVAAYDDTSGAEGDIYYRDSVGNFTRLPIGTTAGSVLNVSGGLPVWGPAVASAATASTIVQRDAGANITVNNVIDGYVATATSATTTTLGVNSAYKQRFTGSTTQTVVMPDVSTLVVGQQWHIANSSTGADASGAITVQSSGLNTIVVLPAGSYVILTCVSLTGTGPGSWSYDQSTSHITVSKTQPTLAVYGDIWIDTN